MNRFRIARRLAVIVAGLAGALVGLGAAAVPAAVAATILPLGGDPHGRPGLARLRRRSTPQPYCRVRGRPETAGDGRAQVALMVTRRRASRTR